MSVYVVTNNLDDGSSGSFRYAINQANANPWSTINFANTVLVITLTTLITISSSVTINGAGISNSVIRGKIAISSGSKTVNISNLTIKDGNSVNGGGLHVGSTATVNLHNIDITNCVALALGGGIYNEGRLYLTNCNFINNNASNGGGIYNAADVLTTGNINISYNTASYLGGGIYNISPLSATLRNITVSNNTAVNGGGIYNGPNNLTLFDVTINKNIADQAGGAVYNIGTLTLEAEVAGNFVISENTAAQKGGAIYSHTGATLVITNGNISGPDAPIVEISQNQATNGGAIYNEGMTVTNISHITKNVSTNNGGGIYNNDTVILSTGDVLVDENFATNKGGGVYNNGTLNIYGSHVINNTAIYGSNIYNV